MNNPQTKATLVTRYRMKTNKTKTQKTKKTPPKNRGSTHTLVTGKQFLFLI
jgi:hypothetical protein